MHEVLLYMLSLCMQTAATKFATVQRTFPLLPLPAGANQPTFRQILRSKVDALTHVLQCAIGQTLRCLTFPCCQLTGVCF